MIQAIIISTLFILSVIYLGNKFRKNFSLKGNDCPGGCSCSGIDIKKNTENNINTQNAKNNLLKSNHKHN